MSAVLGSFSHESMTDTRAIEADTNSNRGASKRMFPSETSEILPTRFLFRRGWNDIS
jgi:hypothetical protein